MHGFRCYDNIAPNANVSEYLYSATTRSLPGCCYFQERSREIVDQWLQNITYYAFFPRLKHEITAVEGRYPVPTISELSQPICENLMGNCSYVRTPRPLGQIRPAVSWWYILNRSVWLVVTKLYILWLPVSVNILKRFVCISLSEFGCFHGYSYGNSKLLSTVVQYQ